MCILPMLERGEGVIAAMTLYVYITNIREGRGRLRGYSCNDPVGVYYQC